MLPLVSVIMPVFNREDLLPESLDSLLGQTYENWECIIVDDGSTDATVEIAKSYENKDNRFRLYNRPADLKKGAASCRNYGFKKSKGDYFQYLDSDDIISCNKLQIQLNEITGKRNVMAASSWKIFKEFPEENAISIDAKSISSGTYAPLEIFKYLGEKNTYLPVHSYLTPANLIEAAGNWNEDLCNNDDAEFFVRVLVQAENIQVNEKVLAFYRKTDSINLSSYSSMEKLESVVKSWQLIEDHLFDFYGKEAEGYVENSKQRLFQNLNWENPDLIKPHSKFFRKYIRQRKAEQRKNIIKRISRKLKKKLGL